MTHRPRTNTPADPRADTEPPGPPSPLMEMLNGDPSRPRVGCDPGPASGGEVTYSRGEHAAHSGSGGWDLETWDCVATWADPRPPEVPADAERRSGYVDTKGRQHTFWVRRAPMAPGICPRCPPARLAELARDDLKASLERLHDLGWRLTTGGGDTVDRLALVHLSTGERLAVWTAPAVPKPESALLEPTDPWRGEAWPLCSAVGCRDSVAGQHDGDSFCAAHLASRTLNPGGT